MKRWLALAPLAALASCKLGGPSADPNAYLASDSGEDATVEGGHGDDGPVPLDDSGRPVPPGDDSGTDDASAPDGRAGGACVDAAVAVCDPVHNTGCNPLQQCDVGTSLTMMPTGNCVFYNGTEAGGACTMSPVNESCPPGNTCVNSSCHTICFCDTDCRAGQCCSDTTGVQGFTLCARCM